MKEIARRGIKGNVVITYVSTNQLGNLLVVRGEILSPPSLFKAGLWTDI
jgi:hypothetical protein